MTVRAKEDAFRQFDAYVGFTSVRQVADVEVEAFAGRIDVMPSECGDVAVVSAAGAATAGPCDQLDLAPQAPLLLASVILMAHIGVGVLACPGTETTLTPLKAATAGDALQIGFHPERII